MLRKGREGGEGTVLHHKPVGGGFLQNGMQRKKLGKNRLWRKQISGDQLITHPRSSNLYIVLLHLSRPCLFLVIMYSVSRTLTLSLSRISSYYRSVCVRNRADSIPSPSDGSVLRADKFPHANVMGRIWVGSGSERRPVKGEATLAFSMQTRCFIWYDDTSDCAETQ